MTRPLDEPGGPEPRSDALPGALFERVDESDDTEFYRVPRLVQHIDEVTCAALTGYYRDVLRPGSAVLDLMSSWVSHLPDDLPLARVVGHGMNAVELESNPRLTEHFVQDLNRTPALPMPGRCFDAVLLAVSVQYLVRPVEVFREVGRVLKPDGPVVIGMSHRCFPTKAIRAFQVLEPTQRVRLVTEYLRLAGGFGPARFVDRSPAGGDPMWIVTAAAAPAS